MLIRALKKWFRSFLVIVQDSSTYYDTTFIAHDAITILENFEIVNVQF